MGLRDGNQNVPSIQGNQPINRLCSTMRKKKEDGAIILWNPPPHESLEWNVDGSSRGKPGPVGIGGVFRNERGEVKALFAVLVGIKDSNEVEFMAIVYALEMSLLKELVKNRRIIIESDSKNSITWDCPWNLHFHCNKQHNILTIPKNMVFTKRNREANQIADSLAKEGA